MIFWTQFKPHGVGVFYCLDEITNDNNNDKK